MSAITQIQAEFQAAVVEATKELYPDFMPSHGTLAMDFVLTGAVDIEQRTVVSDDHAYHIDIANGCTCKYAQFQSKYCKHYVALQIAERAVNLQQENIMPESNPQTDWEAQVQNGDTSPNLFSDEEYLPEPEVPQAVQEASERVYQGVPLDHQYTDYPSTLYIERYVGQTKIGMTFRGENDMEQLNRAINVIKALDKMAPKQAPEGRQPPQQQAAPQPTPEQQMPGQAPLCPMHQTPMAPSKFPGGGWYCKRRTDDGQFCNQKAKG